MEETPTYTSGRSTKAFKLKVEYRKTVRVDAVCGLPPIGIVSEFEFQLNRASHRRHSADRTRIAGRRPSPQLVRCANRQPSDVHRVIAALYRTVAAHLKLQNKGVYAMSHKTTTAGSWIAQRPKVRRTGYVDSGTRRRVERMRTSERVRHDAPFGRVGMAIADAGDRHLGYSMPPTSRDGRLRAIREADTEGNPDTAHDPARTPAIRQSVISRIRLRAVDRRDRICLP